MIIRSDSGTFSYTIYTTSGSTSTGIWWTDPKQNEPNSEQLFRLHKHDPFECEHDKQKRMRREATFIA